MGRPEIRRLQKIEEKKKKRENKVQNKSDAAFDSGYDMGFRQGARYAASRIDRLFTTAFVATLYDKYHFVARNREVLDIVYAQL